MNVSIVIANWNTCDILHDCLISIYEQESDIDYEIIVVDNASTDGSVEMLRKEFPQVVLIANTENRGLAAANNQGIKLAKGRYVLLLNSDTKILDNAISKSVAFADSHPNSAVVGCRVLNPDQTLQPTCFMFPSILNMLLSSSYLYKVFPKSTFFGREMMSWWGRMDTREVDVVTGCFMLVRQEAIKQVGMVDEQFFMYAEETDWCYRIKQAGWKVLFTPIAEIIHLGEASSKKIKPTMVLQLRASILLFFKKHKGKLSYGVACLLVSLFFFVRVPFWLVMAVFSKSMRHQCLQTTRTYIAGAFKALLGWRALCFNK